MTYDPEEHDRHSIRLRGYDNTPSGAYSICIQNRKSLFGKIVHGATHLNDAGRMVENIWNALPILHPGLETDEFIVKLNHQKGPAELFDRRFQLTTGRCQFRLIAGLFFNDRDDKGGDGIDLMTVCPSQQISDIVKRS